MENSTFSRKMYNEKDLYFKIFLMMAIIFIIRVIANCLNCNCYHKTGISIINLLLLLSISMDYFTNRINRKDKFLKYLGAALIFIMIFKFISTVYIYKFLYYKKSIELLFIVIESYMKIIFIIYCIKVIGRDVNNKVMLLNYSFITLFFICISFSRNISKVNTNSYRFYQIINSNGVVLTLLSLILILYLVKIKKIMNKNLYDILMCFSTINLFCNSILWSYSANSYKFIMYISLLNYFSYLIIYKYFLNESYILDIKNINLFKDEKEQCKRFIDSIEIPLIISKKDEICYVNKNGSKFINKNRSMLKYFPEDKCNNEIFISELMNLQNNEQKIMNYKHQTMILEDGTSLDVDLTIFNIELSEESYMCIYIKNNTVLNKLETLEQECRNIKEENKFKMEFFADLSHELRTPINVIYSAIQVMDINLENKKDDFLKKYMNIIKQNCYRLLRIINNLIDSTKIEEGYYKPNLKNINIVELVESVVTSVCPYVYDNNINIIFDTDVEEKVVACDKDMMERIILNLISNSVKYKKDGLGKILVEITDKKDKVSISVKDNGIGIPSSLQKDIFKRFVQAPNNTSKSQGSGIGLSLVKSMVDIHKGQIGLISEENKGTEIIIEIPSKTVSEEQYIIDEFEKSYIIKNANIEFSDVI
ncbi:HAMP domain-containing histidine kinase [Clostridium niameyense]|uniref:histidine kinase n=1 Tax=Clostridium niameyense TaxID=1622073 RepID=A0A6M0RCM4_9CLOT|nr:HAMP domain-containing sensor histidine kinase [Clostridium niameyense]NEZ46918.1 HAMP domain-containing histidine kinase [Clostridium niameyense]